VGKHTTLAIQSFFQNGKLLRELNHILLTLVPKIQKASSLSEYRPIACCNQLYKFITKVMSNRLKQVIGELISGNQNAFLLGRNINDCTSLAHELARDFKKKGGGVKAGIKVDLKKAFDIVNRNFMYFIMQNMGLPMKWIG